MPRIIVGPGDFDVGAELATLQVGTETGAVASFLGLVRGTANGNDLVRGTAHGNDLIALTLEHYPGMTEAALAGIADVAMTRWHLRDCLIIHRTGRLEPGARIVLAAAASPHRSDALDATAFLIDWLKTDAPFWKREDFADGTSSWVAPRETDQTARDRWTGR